MRAVVAGSGTTTNWLLVSLATQTVWLAVSTPYLLTAVENDCEGVADGHGK